MDTGENGFPPSDYAKATTDYAAGMTTGGVRITEKNDASEDGRLVKRQVRCGKDL